MCGITGILGSSSSYSELRRRALECSKKVRHRGPDWNGVAVLENFPRQDESASSRKSSDSKLSNSSAASALEAAATVIKHSVNTALAHERLAIVDPDSGRQPLISRDGRVLLAINGEIYNFKELKKQLKEPYQFTTESDCEVIIPLYQQFGVPQFINMLRGMFSFVLIDTTNNYVIAVRDHIGITPLYSGFSVDGATWFCSEMKGMHDDCVQFECFPPGHYYDTVSLEYRQWYKPTWLVPGHIAQQPLDLVKLREAFIESVRVRMMSDVPWGVLLSGGLDSSLVASVVAREFRDNQKPGGSGDRQFWTHALHSFTIGLPGSSDLIAAQQVAATLGTVHHSFTFSVQEGLDALEDVIYHIETYNLTTVRASVPMYLMARKIKALSIKMVLSGEGSDEAFGGYLYFHKAPSPEAFHRETIDKLLALHQHDNLRANKSTAAWGLEVRVPFLDKHFLEHVMNIDTREKMCDIKRGRMEKFMLRKAFDTPDDPYLPKEILWRQKEQFSDGVGHGWIDALKVNAENMISDQQMAMAPRLFPLNTPRSKEAYYYRSIFAKFFPREVAAQTVPGGLSVACSTAAAIEWDPKFKTMDDPSGRAVVDVYSEEATGNTSARVQQQ